MASAAIANKVTMESATNTMVWPFSRCAREIVLFFLIPSSIHIWRDCISRNLSDSRIAGARRQELDHVVETPLVGIADADVRTDHVDGAGGSCDRFRKGILALNRQRQRPGAAASGSRVGPGQWRGGARRGLRAQAAVVNPSRLQIGIHQIPDSTNRRRSAACTCQGKVI